MKKKVCYLHSTLSRPKFLSHWKILVFVILVLRLSLKWIKNKMFFQNSILCPFILLKLSAPDEKKVFEWSACEFWRVFLPFRKIQICKKRNFSAEILCSKSHFFSTRNKTRFSFHNIEKKNYEKYLKIKWHTHAHAYLQSIDSRCQSKYLKSWPFRTHQAQKG